MKTNILITALMITFSTWVIAGSNQLKSEDSIFTSSLASIAGSLSAESTGTIAVPGIAAAINPSVGLFENNANLEEWIESRELWEQENSEMEAVNLEAWINGRESWEQESSELNAVSTVNYSALLEEWVTEREAWEQENSGTGMTRVSMDFNQEEWIYNREAWEQK